MLGDGSRTSSVGNISSSANAERPERMTVTNNNNAEKKNAKIMVCNGHQNFGIRIAFNILSDYWVDTWCVPAFM